MREWRKYTIPDETGLAEWNAVINAAPPCDHPNEIPDDEPPCRWCGAGDTDVRGLFCSEECAGFSDVYDDGFEAGSTAARYEIAGRLRDLMKAWPPDILRSWPHGGHTLGSDIAARVLRLAAELAPTDDGE